MCSYENAVNQQEISMLFVRHQISHNSMSCYNMVLLFRSYLMISAQFRNRLTKLPLSGGQPNNLINCNITKYKDVPHFVTNSTAQPVSKRNTCSRNISACKRSKDVNNNSDLSV